MGIPAGNGTADLLFLWPGRVGSREGGPFTKIRLLVPSTIRRDNRNWRQEVTPPWGAFPLSGHRLPGWWSEAGPAWRGGELIEQGWSWVTVPLLPQRRFLWTEQRIACWGGGLIRADSAIIISVLGCHVLDICFPAVNSLPLMPPKTVYPAGTKYYPPWILPTPHVEPNGREFTLSELIPGTAVYFSKLQVRTPISSICRQVKALTPPGSLSFPLSFVLFS